MWQCPELVTAYLKRQLWQRLIADWTSCPKDDLPKHAEMEFAVKEISSRERGRRSKNLVITETVMTKFLDLRPRCSQVSWPTTLTKVLPWTMVWIRLPVLRTGDSSVKIVELERVEQLQVYKTATLRQSRPNLAAPLHRDRSAREKVVNVSTSLETTRR